jgi:hypothetical protein
MVLTTVLSHGSIRSRINLQAALKVAETTIEAACHGCGAFRRHWKHALGGSPPCRQPRHDSELANSLVAEGLLRTTFLSVPAV